MGYNMDSLFALPCMKSIHPDYLNLMLLYSYANGHNNVLIYMIRKKITITEHWKILRLIILSSRKNDLELVLRNYDVNIKDNYGNTPIMVSKYLGNLTMQSIIMKYKPDLTIRNNNNATYHNMSINMLPFKLCYVGEYQEFIISALKKYDLFVSNIKPNKKYQIVFKLCQVLIFILTFLLYAYLVI